MQFDPLKNEVNIAKHGVSFERAADLEILAVIADDRQDYGEVRYRAFGLIDGVAHCLVFTDRAGVLRPISLRRAHQKEMKLMSPRPLIDTENPEWTAQDFAQAKGAESLPAHVLAAFPKTAARGRGAQKAPTKTPVSIRLDQAVLDHFKAEGPGWQGRINDALLGLIRR